MSSIDTQNPGEANPSRNFFPITPHDTTNFVEGETRGIYVGGSGILVAVNKGGVAVTFTNVLAGSVLPIRAVRVNASGTTATDLVGLL